MKKHTKKMYEVREARPRCAQLTQQMSGVRNIQQYFSTGIGGYPIMSSMLSKKRSAPAQSQTQHNKMMKPSFLGCEQSISPFLSFYDVIRD